MQPQAEMSENRTTTVAVVAQTPQLRNVQDTSWMSPFQRRAIELEKRNRIANACWDAYTQR